MRINKVRMIGGTMDGCGMGEKSATKAECIVLLLLLLIARPPAHSQVAKLT